MPDPALVRKSDGGFNYMTTDLATIDYRLKTWSPDEIVYVVDDRQSGHFKKLFLTFARWKSQRASGVPPEDQTISMDDKTEGKMDLPAGSTAARSGASGTSPEDQTKCLANLSAGKMELPAGRAAAHSIKLVHVGFGKIMGDDGKPFKTRSGDTVKLGDLLDEAEERAFKIVSEKSAELPEAQRKEIARVIGLGAVKYADLLPNRQSDYIFSWDKMLALQGNTAPYLQYAYARIKSIFRKAESRNEKAEIILAAPEELALAKHLLNFGLTLEAVGEEFRPNYLCNYLFELAGKFTSFYENCPVLKADDEATRNSRLALCDLTARVLKQGLETLGIEVVEQM
jgi:arginyl-tRNA synthetase